MKRTLLALLLWSGWVAGPLGAEIGADPTRPPAHIDAGPGATPPTASGLQSIIRRHGARPAAVINGVYVELGGRVGEARLERVGEDSVVLRGAAGREILQLTPGIGKQPVANGKDGALRPGDDRRGERRAMEDAKP